MVKVIVPLVVVSLIVIVGCEKITGEFKPNIPPTIRFVNVPPETTGGAMTQLKHGTEIFWEAHDEDGRIVRYDWAHRDTMRWNHLYTDSGMATQAAIPFWIPTDSLYENTLWVRAVDNDGAHSPIISRTYVAYGNIPPFGVRIAEGPADSTIHFILPRSTATWQGLEFAFAVSDSDSVLVPEFSWAWNQNTNWSAWSRDRYYYAIGEHIYGAAPTPYPTKFCTLYVRARDDSEREATDTLQLLVKLVYPSFENDVLVVDETWDARVGPPGEHDDPEIDSFYELILGESVDSVLDNSQRPNIELTPEDLGPYRILVYHNDEFSRQELEEYADLLSIYLDVGGSLWLIGGLNLTELRRPDFYIEEYFGIAGFSKQIRKDFRGATHAQSASMNLPIDPDKLYQLWYPDTLIDNVETVVLEDGATPIFRFDSGTDEEGVEGAVCGWSYDAGSHRVVVFTFPLYWTTWDPVTGEPAKSVADDVLDFLR